MSINNFQLWIISPLKREKKKRKESHFSLKNIIISHIPSKHNEKWSQRSTHNVLLAREKVTTQDGGSGVKKNAMHTLWGSVWVISTRRAWISRRTRPTQRYIQDSMRPNMRTIAITVQSDRLHSRTYENTRAYLRWRNTPQHGRHKRSHALGWSNNAPR